MSKDKSPIHVFVVDDDREMRESLSQFLTKSGCRVETFGTAQNALDACHTMPPDVMVSDIRMPGMSGLDLLSAVAETEMGISVLLITAHGDVPMAVDAMKAGAFDFVEKPFQPDRLLDSIKRAADYGSLRRENDRLRDRLKQLAGLDAILIGQSPQMQRIREDIEDVASSDAPVLILGETGTGKELVAHALHDLSGRSAGPFIAINCAALPSDAFDETMFGTENGTDGVFVQSDRGTLFLDELGACPLVIQAKLLRVLETQQFTPRDATHARQVDVRVVSASNENLEAAVLNGQFRDDLFYRLNTVPISLPPLRERGEDVPLLFTHFLDQYVDLYEIEALEQTPEDIAALLGHDWPGNVRELRHVAERRVLAARRGRGSIPEAINRDGDHDDVPATLREAVAAFERQLIGKAIQQHAGRMDAVAEALGIGRRTLNEKIVKLGLNKDELL